MKSGIVADCTSTYDAALTRIHETFSLLRWEKYHGVAYLFVGADIARVVHHPEFTLRTRE
jgi:hypothetical protein